MRLHQTTLEAAFREQPPATINEAVRRIKQRTGIKRSPTQVRQFLKRRGLRCRKVGVLPAKVDSEAQEEFKKTVRATLRGCLKSHDAVQKQDKVNPHEDPIGSFRGYVAVTTSRVCNDALPLMYPSLWRVKYRLRYFFNFGLFDPNTPAEVVVTDENTPVSKNVMPTGHGLMGDPSREIIVPLPADGKLSAGNVVVRQRNHESNTVPLTEWWVKARLVHYFYSMDEPQPSVTFEFNLHFRAKQGGTGRNGRTAGHVAVAWKSLIRRTTYAKSAEMKKR